MLESLFIVPAPWATPVIALVFVLAAVCAAYSPLAGVSPQKVDAGKLRSIRNPLTRGLTQWRRLRMIFTGGGIGVLGLIFLGSGYSTISGLRSDLETMQNDMEALSGDFERQERALKTQHEHDLAAQRDRHDRELQLTLNDQELSSQINDQGHQRQIDNLNNQIDRLQDDIRDDEREKQELRDEMLELSVDLEACTSRLEQCPIPQGAPSPFRLR